MGYYLFLLVTATLFVRPAEIFPAVYAWPIYNYLILACLAVSLPGVLRQLSTQSLAENPITACVIGLWAAVVLSHLSHLYIWGARMSGFDFFKIVVYYLLLVANVNSEQRLKSFLRLLLLLITVSTVLALLSAYEIMRLPGVQFLAEQAYDKATGQMVVIPRLQSTGIFNDPNDFAMILVAGVILALYFFTDRSAGLLRWLGLALAGLFGFAIYGTQSRGGLLALVAALLSLCHARWGWKRSAVIAAVALPVLLVAFKGRMTNLDDAMGDGTGHSRVELWSEGLQLFKQRPLFGIGMGNYSEEVGQPAHNSFIHAFAELGIFGGALFLGAFAAALIMLFRLRADADFLPSSYGRGAGGESAPPAVPEHMLPYLTAILVGFAVSIFSLSRNYVASTYVPLGLATAYVQIVARQTGSFPLAFDFWFLKRLAAGSVGFIAFIYVFIRVAAR